MKSKIKKHIFGYNIFEENVPFSKLEDGDFLLKADDEFKRNHNWSFIKMNDNYIELIDASYARLGKGLSSIFFFIPVFLYILLEYSFFGNYMENLICSLFGFFFFLFH